VRFGEGFIEISGQTVGGSGELYDDPDTVGINEDGDLTGLGPPGFSRNLNMRRR
jgi:hypothetical protein